MNYNDLNKYLYYYAQHITYEKNKILLNLIKNPEKIDKIVCIQIENVENIHINSISEEDADFYPMVMGFDSKNQNQYMITTEKQTISFASISSPCTNVNEKRIEVEKGTSLERSVNKKDSSNSHVA